MSIKTADLKDGVSVNRSKYCENPKHTLWSIQDVDPPVHCEYIQKEGAVCAARLDMFPQNHSCINPNIELTLSYKHSPEFCNYSHSLIVLSQVPENKKNRIDLKIVLAELFSEII